MSLCLTVVFQPFKRCLHNPCYSMFVVLTVYFLYQGGQLLWLGGHFEKAAFSRGPYLLIEIEASLGSN